MNELDLSEKLNLAQVVEKEESDFNMGSQVFLSTLHGDFSKSN